MNNRYSRQSILPFIGEAGQKKLSESTVAVIGLGALGSVSAGLFARAGIGRLLLLDRDFVELQNLQRQILFSEKDVEAGMPKAIAAARELKRINSEIEIEGFIEDVHAENISSLLSDADLLIDGTDNFETRYLLNDYARKKDIPYIYGGVIRGEGIIYSVTGEGPCLRCLFPDKPENAETCDQAGVLASSSHVVASVQFTEAVKILTGAEAPGALLKFDLWKNEWKVSDVAGIRDQTCLVCAGERFPALEFGQATDTVKLCGRNAVQVMPQETQVCFKTIAERLAKQAEVSFNEYLMTIRASGYELVVFQNGRAVVKGTEDVGVAKSIYSKYIGS